MLDPSRFDYDPDFARAGSLQFMHPLQCSKVLGRPYPEDLASKGQVAFDEDIVAYRAPKPIQGNKYMQSSVPLKDQKMIVLLPFNTLLEVACNIQ